MTHDLLIAEVRLLPFPRPPSNSAFTRRGFIQEKMPHEVMTLMTKFRWRGTHRERSPLSVLTYPVRRTPRFIPTAHNTSRDDVIVTKYGRRGTRRERLPLSALIYPTAEYPISSQPSATPVRQWVGARRLPVRCPVRANISDNQHPSPL